MTDNPYEPPKTHSESSGDSKFTRQIAAWPYLIALIAVGCYILSVVAMDGSIGRQVFSILTIVLASILILAFIVWLVKR